jgi:23S rRNA (guanosine2251-2'-O)-methyltransferase
MFTLCPYPECRHEHPVASSEGKSIAICPRCHRPGSIRSLDTWHRIQAQASTLQSSAEESDVMVRSKKSPVTYGVLEDIRSLWNVGSMFRTADAMGMQKLFLAGITGCPPRKEIAKTSLGAEEAVAWQYLCHPLDLLPRLKNQGVFLLALERCDGSVPLTEVRKQVGSERPIALIVGNEVRGISPETISYCDATAELPMCGIKESLNVAVAFGIAAYALSFFLPDAV